MDMTLLKSIILTKLFITVSATTHWIVTENGRIQPQLDSAFHMRRPYDLLALLDQEERVRKIERMLKDLVAQKEIIDKHWASLEGSPDLKTRLYLQDEDCAHGAKPLTNKDLYPNLSGEFFEWVSALVDETIILKQLPVKHRENTARLVAFASMVTKTSRRLYRYPSGLFRLGHVIAIAAIKGTSQGDAA
ncbi:unnamed protein product, partial [Timema podura]|nr:unnamed protein product [Timema podura]